MSVRALASCMKQEETPTSAQNNASRLPGKIRKLGSATEHFSIHFERSQSTEDEMTGLRPKIEHQDGLGFVRQ